MPSHFSVLAMEYGTMKADEIMSVLRASGYIVVERGAIGRAQREAYYEALEDARLGLRRADSGNERQDCACQTLVA